MTYGFVSAVVINVDVACELGGRFDLDDEIFLIKIERRIALFAQGCCQAKGLIYFT